MIFRLKTNPKIHFRALLPSSSFYVQKDSIRYDFTHEIQADAEWKGHKIIKGRRISVLFRDELI